MRQFENSGFPENDFHHEPPSLLRLLCTPFALRHACAYPHVATTLLSLLLKDINPLSASARTGTDSEGQFGLTEEVTDYR